MVFTAFTSCSLWLRPLLTRGIRNLPRLEDLPDAHLLPSIALIGRPNVGKSALFNRLVRQPEALVYDTPSDHVTRDYREGLGYLGDLRFRVIDTSGIEPTAAADSMQGRGAALTKRLLNSTHGVVMLLDARQGLVPADEELLAWLRRCSKTPLMLVANKADTRAGRQNLDQMTADLMSLGYEPPTAISATSAEGLADLYGLLQPIVDSASVELQQYHSQPHSQHPLPINEHSRWQQQLQQQSQQQRRQKIQQQQQQQQPQENMSSNLQQQQWLQPQQASDASLQSAAAAAEDVPGADVKHTASVTDNPVLDEAEDAQQLGPLRLAILGLPNAGKSTLMNTLLGFERSLTGPEPGLTRDPTYGWMQHQGIPIQIVDTAGWKKASALLPTQSPIANTPSTASKPPTTAGNLGDGSGDDGGHGADARKERDMDKAIKKKLADASILKAKRALDACHVMVLLLDAPRLLTVKQGITRLELKLAGMAIEQGKAVVVALNKADAVDTGPQAAEALRDEVEQMLEARFLAAGRLPVLLLSAAQGHGLQKLLDIVLDSYKKWNFEMSSYKLRAKLAKHTVRFFGTGGTSTLLQRIKWASQLHARPPTFMLQLRGSSEVDEKNQRFLENLLRQTLDLDGVPLRLRLRYNQRYRDSEHTKKKRRKVPLRSQLRRRQQSLKRKRLKGRRREHQKVEENSAKRLRQGRR